MIHITLPQLCSYIDGELAEASTELVRRHLSDCMECTEQFAGLEAQDEVLLRILADDPGETFFQDLSASIPIGQPSRPKPVAGAAGKKAPHSRPKRRAEDQRPSMGARVAWIIATTCLLLVGSAAWVALRPRGSAPPPTPPILQSQVSGVETTPGGLESAQEGGSGQEAPLSDPGSEPEPQRASSPAPKGVAPSAPERLVERAPQHLVPVRTVITETTFDDEEYSTPDPSIPKVSSPGQDRAAVALREAKSASLEAARSKLPWAFDRAANAWEYSLPLFETNPETLALARREVAQSRFQAWAAEPTPARHEAAVASARQYLLYAPPGPERDQAWTWLARLKH